MERKREFIKYMEIFIEEVREGRFIFRMTKKSQNLLKEKLKEELNKEEWANVIA